MVLQALSKMLAFVTFISISMVAVTKSLTTLGGEFEILGGGLTALEETLPRDPTCIHSVPRPILTCSVIVSSFFAPLKLGLYRILSLILMFNFHSSNCSASVNNFSYVTNPTQLNT